MLCNDEEGLLIEAIGFRKFWLLLMGLVVLNPTLYKIEKEGCPDG